MFLASQLVLENQATHLSHLIRFSVASARLQVQDFGDAIPAENVMTAPDSFVETQVTKQST